MQWIVNIIKFKLSAYLQGKIFIWSGAVVDIPIGWALCNGEQGTPDLRDKSIIGAGNSYNPGDTEHNIIHHHDFIAIGVWHAIPAGTDIQPGEDHKKKTPTHLLPGTTFFGPTEPPYYALAFIMKL